MSSAATGPLHIQLWSCFFHPASRPEEFPATVAQVIRGQSAIRDRAAASRSYAERNFTLERFVERFDRSLREVVEGARHRG